MHQCVRLYTRVFVHLYVCLPICVGQHRFQVSLGARVRSLVCACVRTYGHVFVCAHAFVTPPDGYHTGVVTDGLLMF